MTPPAVAGYPHVTVPMGAVHGLAVGLSFVGTAWTEGRLISYAYAYEQATHRRQPPQFPTTVPCRTRPRLQRARGGKPKAR